MALSSKQKQLAELMVDNTDLTNVEYAKEVNIDPKTLYTWKKKPEFQDYMHELCQYRFRDMEKEAIKELRKQMKKGNFKAVQYVLDGTGYKATEKQEIDMDTDINIKIDYGDNQ